MELMRSHARPEGTTPPSDRLAADEPDIVMHPDSNQPCTQHVPSRYAPPLLLHIFEFKCTSICLLSGAGGSGSSDCRGGTGTVDGVTESWQLTISRLMFARTYTTLKYDGTSDRISHTESRHRPVICSCRFTSRVWCWPSHTTSKSRAEKKGKCCMENVRIAAEYWLISKARESVKDCVTKYTPLMKQPMPKASITTRLHFSLLLKDMT